MVVDIVNIVIHPAYVPDSRDLYFYFASLQPHLHAPSAPPSTNAKPAPQSSLAFLSLILDAPPFDPVTCRLLGFVVEEAGAEGEGGEGHCCAAGFDLAKVSVWVGRILCEVWMGQGAMRVGGVLDR